MAEKVSVGKKKKVIAGAIAGAVVVTGVGVGLGVGLGGGDGLPDKLVEFIVEDGGVATVYTPEGEPIAVEDLAPGQTIVFPTPEVTFIGEGDAKQYFVGWATSKEAAVPTYFVGEETITVSRQTQSFYAVYMTASETELEYVDNADEETCTVSYNNEAISSDRGGILVIPNEKGGKKVVGITARATVERQLELQAIINDSSKTEDEKTTAQTELSSLQASETNKSTLKAVVIARGIETVGDYAFYGCENLKQASFVDDVYVVDSEASETQSLTIEEENVVSSIGNYAFYNCETLQSIAIPNGVTTIGNSAFANCTNLASVVVEEESKLASIGTFALYKTKVAEVDLTGCASLTSIGQSVFQHCPELKVVGLPDNTYTTFGKEMFYGSAKLERVSTDLSDPENYEMPEHISSIADSWFRGCESLKKIVLPKDITQMYCKMFENCKELTSIEFREGTNMTGNTGSYVEGNASWAAYFTFNYFDGCEKLESLILPEGFEAIGVYSFRNCKSLKSIKFLATNVDFMSAGTGNVSQIFNGCESLERVEFVEGATVRLTAYIGEGWRATYNTNANHGYLFAGCTSLKYVGIANAQGVIEENTLPGFTGDMYDFMFAGTAIDNFTFPENATTTGNFAFLGCINLSEIEIPEKVTTIGTRSFEGSGLEHVVIPENVTTIGYRAFQRLPRLKSITFNCTNLTSVGGDAFQPYYTGEPFVDANENGEWDEGEEFTDANGDGIYTMQQPIPSQLTKITFGANVTNINFVTGIWWNNAAIHKNLTTIEFLGATVPTITNLPVFDHVTSVIVPAGSLDAYKTAFAGYADRMVEASA